MRGQVRYAVRWRGHSDSVWTVAFSPDGQVVASGSDDNTVRLWNVETGKIIQIIEGRPPHELSFIFDSSCFNVSPKKVSTRVFLSNISSPQQLRTNLYSIDATSQWVLLAGRKVLWIPSGRRPGVFAVRNNRIVIGSDSGRMTFLAFKAGTGPFV